MFKTFAWLAVLGGLAYGAVAVTREAGWQESATRRVVAALDEVLGLKSKSAPKPPERPAVAGPGGATLKPKPEPVPAAAEREPPVKVVTNYVDRSPVPSTYDRVPAEDHKRLNDLIARRLGPAAKR
jgi:hypothetical protein